MDLGKTALTVTALDGSTSFELTVSPGPPEAQSRPGPGVHERLANGGSLVLYQRDFGVGLERAVEEAAGLPDARLASIGQESSPSSSGGLGGSRNDPDTF